MQEINDTIDQFIALKKEIELIEKKLESKRELFNELRVEVAKHADEFFDGNMNTDYGIFRTYTMRHPSWWQYSPTVKGLESKLKALKKQEQKKGIAKLSKSMKGIRLVKS